MVMADKRSAHVLGRWPRTPTRHTEPTRHTGPRRRPPRRPPQP